jgi:exodeoxyribonuclease VII small subunit
MNIPNEPLNSLTPTPVEQLNYEQAVRELEQIVRTLEIDDLTLDTALVLFERGQELANHCKELLNQAELKVKLITGEELEKID